VQLNEPLFFIIYLINARLRLAQTEEETRGKSSFSVLFSSTVLKTAFTRKPHPLKPSVALPEE
jgi:hypothetical protein